MGVFVEEKKRTHRCGELRAEHAGQRAVLMGWVQTVRVHSRWVFIDLRDREGVTQVVCHSEVSDDVFQAAKGVRQEYVIAVEGEVTKRAGKPNPKLPTGEIELVAADLEILIRSKPVPIQVEDEIDANEETRLQYRYLDLRRRPMVAALRTRSELNRVIRNTMHDLGFWELETPILTKSTPEGARDYLVPSRVYPGQVFALPQSPQLFKQLFMVAGYDRYYQICRCFRDEDLRGDRQPEFTQLDIEMSFVTPAEVQEVVETVVARALDEILGVKLELPVPHMSYDEAIERYGSDKPDLRYDMPLHDITELTRTANLPPLSAAAKVKALRFQGNLSRKQLDALGAEIKADYAGFRARNRLEVSAQLSNVPSNDVSALDVDPVEREREYQARWETGGFQFFGSFNDLMSNQEANETAAEFVRAKIRAKVSDPQVADLLCPQHTLACKRPVLDSGYFETFNRSNVLLVDIGSSPIEEITPSGLRTTTTEYDLDCIIFATGFDAMTGTLLKIGIQGRDGLTLREKWSAGPLNYLGLTVAGFPNLFAITGPGSPSVLTNMVVAIEQHVEWITDCIEYMREQGHRRIEATAAAEKEWVEHVNAVADRTLYPTCTSWYLGANIPGKPRVFMPLPGFPHYVEKCDEVAANGYEGFVLS